MEMQLLSKINSIARYTLAFVFVYHGLVPKILWLSPIEASLSNAHNLDAVVASPLAGVLEIILALSILLFKNSLIPVYFAITLLIVFLLDVMVIMPSLLIEAFNPVTINLASIVIAYFVCITHTHAKSYNKSSNSDASRSAGT